MHVGKIIWNLSVSGEGYLLMVNIDIYYNQLLQSTMNTISSVSLYKQNSKIVVLKQFQNTGPRQRMSKGCPENLLVSCFFTLQTTVVSCSISSVGEAAGSLRFQNNTLSELLPRMWLTVKRQDTLGISVELHHQWFTG